MNKKILLLFPNTSDEGVMPLAIAILSNIAKNIGYTIKYFETSFFKKEQTSTEDHEKTGEFKSLDRKDFIDFKQSENMYEDFNAVLNEYKPDILAVSANSLEYALFAEIIQNAEFEEFKPFVIIGGVHATIAPDEVINNPLVDAICRGEGEKAWEEFLVKYKTNNDLTNIKNIWIKKGNEIFKNSLRPLLTEDELWESPLDLSLFDDRHFLYVFDGIAYKKGNIELSRGCPYNCTYCVNSAFKDIYKGLGKFMRIRPIENIKSAILQLINIDCEILYFQDESFLSIPYKVLKDFCSWYEKEIKLPFLIMARPESVRDDKVKLIADMQLPFQVSLGVESGSQRILKDICNRKTKVEDIENAVKILKKYNIRTTAYTMVGFPTETREEAFLTINLIRSLNIENSVMSIFYPFYGVPLRDYCLKHDYITGNEKARTFTDKSILKNQPMSAEEISNIRRTYALYTKLPEKYLAKIEDCERDYESHKDLFNELVLLLYKDYYNSWNFKL
jgi:anaerobic magnesium-protoporphyrin IX monomethyl ester cyclase